MADRMRAEALRDLVRKKANESKAKSIFIVMYDDQITWTFTNMGGGEALDRMADAYVSVRKSLNIPKEDDATQK